MDKILQGHLKTWCICLFHLQATTSSLLLVTTWPARGQVYSSTAPPTTRPLPLPTLTGRQVSLIIWPSSQRCNKIACSLQSCQNHRDKQLHMNRVMCICLCFTLLWFWFILFSYGDCKTWSTVKNELTLHWCSCSFICLHVVVCVRIRATVTWNYEIVLIS